MNDVMAMIANDITAKESETIRAVTGRPCWAVWDIHPDKTLPGLPPAYRVALIPHHEKQIVRLLAQSSVSVRADFCFSTDEAREIAKNLNLLADQIDAVVRLRAAQGA